MKPLQILFLISLAMGVACASEPFPITYDSEAMFSKDKSIKRKTIYLNEDGTLAFKQCFEFADAFHEGRAWIGSTDSDAKGYIDTHGKVVIDPQYHSLTKFSQGLAAVSIKDFKYFYIDANGKKISDKIYNSADAFSHGLAAVKQTEKCSYLDKDETVVIDEVAKSCYEFTDDAIARVKSANNVWRFIDKKGSFVTQGYEEANDFHEGLAVVQKERKWGVINTKGDWVVPPSFQELDYKYKQGLLAAKKEGLWGFIDTKGHWVIEPSFEATYGFGENGLSPVKKEGKWGYINTKGEIAIPMQFETAWQFDKNGWANVKKEGKRIYIDGSGNEVQNKHYQLLKSSKECAEFLSKI